MKRKPLLTKKTISISVKVFLLGIVPLATLGFNVFEGSSLYAGLIGLRGLDQAIATRLTTQYSDPHRMILDPLNSPEQFHHLWELARQYSSARLPATPPLEISRLAVENGSYVDLPNRGKVVLIPESAPVFAMWCPESDIVAKTCKESDGIMLGTVSDVREWYAKRQKAVHFAIDFMVAAVSIILGFIVEFGPKDGNQ